MRSKPKSTKSRIEIRKGIKWIYHSFRISQDKLKCYFVSNHTMFKATHCAHYFSWVTCWPEFYTHLICSYLLSIGGQTHKWCHLWQHFAFLLLKKKANRFHVVEGLFSNRSQRTSKRGKDISDTLGCTSSAILFPYHILTLLWYCNFHALCWISFARAARLIIYSVSFVPWRHLIEIKDTICDLLQNRPTATGNPFITQIGTTTAIHITAMAIGRW